jgi:hypothetical protein
MANNFRPFEDTPLIVDGRRTESTDFDDDGAGRLAIIGVVIVLVVIAAGIALNLTV